MSFFVPVLACPGELSMQNSVDGWVLDEGATTRQWGRHIRHSGTCEGGDGRVGETHCHGAVPVRWDEEKERCPSCKLAHTSAGLKACKYWLKFAKSTVKFFSFPWWMEYRVIITSIDLSVKLNAEVIRNHTFNNVSFVFKAPSSLSYSRSECLSFTVCRVWH